MGYNPKKCNLGKHCFSILISPQFDEGTVGQKIKKVQAKKTREIKYINFTKIYFDQMPFLRFQKILELGKSVKLPKMQFYEKKIFFII